MKGSLTSKRSVKKNRKSSPNELELFLLFAVVISMFFALLSSMYVRQTVADASSINRAAAEASLYVEQTETRLKNEETIDILKSMIQFDKQQ